MPCTVLIHRLLPIKRTIDRKAISFPHIGPQFVLLPVVQPADLTIQQQVCQM